MLLAESQLPHGHPSESSIQFALYSDKQLSHEKEAPVDRRRPSHSVAQGILYGSSETDTALTSPAHGHPSNSTAQSLPCPQRSTGHSVPQDRGGEGGERSELSRHPSPQRSTGHSVPQDREGEGGERSELSRHPSPQRSTEYNVPREGWVASG